MYPHRIRLRGPWECEPAGLPPRRVTIPCRWADAGLAGVRGTARFIRRFGYPGKADPEFEHIWLTCAGCSDVVNVCLNGTVFGENLANEFAFDVTPFMLERNQLLVIIDATSDAAGLWGEVALEIRKDAYLAKVGARLEGTKLVVTGIVVGTSPQPLELYTLLDKRHGDYRKISPTPEGTPFFIELPETPPTSAFVRVELVNISAIWYVVEVPISHWQSA